MVSHNRSLQPGHLISRFKVPVPNIIDVTESIQIAIAKYFSTVDYNKGL